MYHCTVPGFVLSYEQGEPVNLTGLPNMPFIRRNNLDSAEMTGVGTLTPLI